LQIDSGVLLELKTHSVHLAHKNSSKRFEAGVAVVEEGQPPRSSKKPP
jgi:hypothetical protein